MDGLVIGLNDMVRPLFLHRCIAVVCIGSHHRKSAPCRAHPKKALRMEGFA
jgi:hypothetical protein